MTYPQVHPFHLPILSNQNRVVAKVVKDDTAFTGSEATRR